MSHYENNLISRLELWLHKLLSGPMINRLSKVMIFHTIYRGTMSKNFVRNFTQTVRKRSLAINLSRLKKKVRSSIESSTSTSLNKKNCSNFLGWDEILHICSNDEYYPEVKSIFLSAVTIWTNYCTNRKTWNSTLNLLQTLLTNINTCERHNVTSVIPVMVQFRSLKQMDIIAPFSFRISMYRTFDHNLRHL